MRYKVGAEQLQQVPSLVHRPDTVFQAARTAPAPPTPSAPPPARSPAGSRPIGSRCWPRLGDRLLYPEGPRLLRRSHPSALGVMGQAPAGACPRWPSRHRRAPGSQPDRGFPHRSMRSAAGVRLWLHPCMSGRGRAGWYQPARRSSSQPATAVRLAAAAPSRLVGMPATLGIGCGGCGGSSTPVPGTSGATRNGAQ